MRVQKLFHSIDENGDGSITSMELSNALQAMGNKIPDDQLANLMKIADQNGDGAPRRPISHPGRHAECVRKGSAPTRSGWGAAVPPALLSIAPLVCMLICCPKGGGVAPAAGAPPSAALAHLTFGVWLPHDVWLLLRLRPGAVQSTRSNEGQTKGGWGGVWGGEAVWTLMKSS